jgi:hypothetical protein
MATPEDRPGQRGKTPVKPFGIPIPEPKREESSKNFPLVPTLNMVVTDVAEAHYAAEALEIYQNEQNEHPEIFARKKGETDRHYMERKNIRAQVKFIQTAFAWKKPHYIAPYLGTSPGRIANRDFRQGGRKGENPEKFKKRLRGTYAIASIFTRYIHESLDKRDAIERINGLISDVRFEAIAKDGKLNVAVCIVQGAVRQWEKSQDHQVDEARIGKRQELPKLYDGQTPMSNGDQGFDSTGNNLTIEADLYQAGTTKPDEPDWKPVGDGLEEGPLDHEFP